MILGIMSDIHSNFEALTAAYASLESAHCDRILCLGDLVGYCASPKECLDFIRSKNIQCIRGNHDSYVCDPTGNWRIQPFAKEAIYWTCETLPKSDVEWLSQLPLTIKEEEFEAVHASLLGVDGLNWPYILGQQNAIYHFFMQERKVCFYGHTHVPLIFSFDPQKTTMEYLSTRVLSHTHHEKFLINCGSVGQPRDYNKKASLLVYDTKTMLVRHLRVEYDIVLAQKKIFEAKLPPILAERLSGGF